MIASKFECGTKKHISVRHLTKICDGNFTKKQLVDTENQVLSIIGWSVGDNLTTLEFIRYKFYLEKEKTEKLTLTLTFSDVVLIHPEISCLTAPWDVAQACIDIAIDSSPQKNHLVQQIKEFIRFYINNEKNKKTVDKIFTDQIKAKFY